MLVLSLIASLAIAAPTMATKGLCPGPVQIAMQGATPSGRVIIASNSHLGGFIIPTGPCLGTAVDIDTDGVELAHLRADPTGALRWDKDLDDTDCGRWLQAVDVTTCEVGEPTRVPGPGVKHALWFGGDYIPFDDGVYDELFDEGVTVTGTYLGVPTPVQVGQWEGLSIPASGAGNLLDPGEQIRFEFFRPAAGVELDFIYGYDLDGDGRHAESIIEGFDASGASMGTVAFDFPPLSYLDLDVSALFGGRPLSAFTLEPTDDALSVWTLYWWWPR